MKIIRLITISFLSIMVPQASIFAGVHQSDVWEIVEKTGNTQISDVFSFSKGAVICHLGAYATRLPEEFNYLQNALTNSNILPVEETKNTFILIDENGYIIWKDALDLHDGMHRADESDLTSLATASHCSLAKDASFIVAQKEHFFEFKIISN